MTTADLNCPVFIIGCPRSGNTLLGCILNKHPDFLIFFEQNLFNALYRRWEYRVRHGDDPHDVFLALTERFCSDVLGAANVDLASYHAAVRNTSIDWQSLLNEFAATTMAAGKPSSRRFGDKTPHHLARVDIILNHYPEAKFLFVYRDPRDTVYSMTKPSFSYTSDNPILNAYVVENYYNTFRQHLEDGLPDNILKVCYEDLVRTPEEETRRICDFLDVAFTPSMLEAEEGGIQALVGAGWVGYKGWGEVQPQPSSKKNPLKDHPIINWMLSEWIQQLGYDYMASAPGFAKRTRAGLETFPLRLQEKIFQIPWRWKYPQFSPFLLEKPVSSRMMKSWLLGGE